MGRSTDFHEDFHRDELVSGPSDRGFGFVFCGVFAVLAGLLAWGESDHWVWAAAAAAIFLALALIAPKLLGPLNRLWLRFGLLLHKVMTPVLMGAFFFGGVLPIGLLMRIFGARPLQIRFDSKAASYWIERDPAPVSFKDQF